MKKPEAVTPFPKWNIDMKISSQVFDYAHVDRFIIYYNAVRKIHPCTS